MASVDEDEKDAYERLQKSRKLGLCQTLSKLHREEYLEGKTPLDRFVFLGFYTVLMDKSEIKTKFERKLYI